MRELRNWLSTQLGGVEMFEEYQRRSIAMQATEPENAAMLRLLGDLSGRFAECYDEQPLTVATANEAWSRLLDLTDKAIVANAAPATEKLKALNEISRASLDRALADA